MVSNVNVPMSQLQILTRTSHSVSLGKSLAFRIWVCEFFFNVYLFLRETETERGGGEGGARAEREGDTESETGSRL